jgi:hypothetical protein
MRTWKTFVSMLGISACAAILGAACTAEVQDGADTGAPTESTEEGLAREGPRGLESPVVVLPRVRERCVEECDRIFNRCLYKGRPDYICRHEHEGCRRQCDRY